MQMSIIKSKQSAANSFKNLFSSFSSLKESELNAKLQNANALEATKEYTKAMAEFGNIWGTKLLDQQIQESKNLLKLSPTEILSWYRNKNMLPTNSKEHLIYKFKQNMKGAQSNGGAFADMF